MAGWINDGSEDRAIKKMYVGINGKARECGAAWIGVDGKARKIWPMYIRHYHVNSGVSSDGNRDSSDRDTGYDTTDTLNAEISSAKGGCFMTPYVTYTYQQARTVHQGSASGVAYEITAWDAGNGSFYYRCPYCGVTGSGYWPVGSTSAPSRTHDCTSSSAPGYRDTSYTVYDTKTGVTNIEPGAAGWNSGWTATSVKYKPNCGYMYGQLIAGND